MCSMPQKAAAEAEAQGHGGLRLKGQGGVVELQLFQRVPQVGILGAVLGVDAAVDHGTAPGGSRAAARAAGLAAPVTVSPTRVSCTFLMEAVK